MKMKFEPNWFNPRTPAGKDFIRIGGPHDGGYVLVDDLDGIDHVISIGVGSDVSFDLDMANRGFDVVLIDGTVSRPPVTHERFRFVRSMWDENETTIKSVTKPGSCDQILKIDTEGAEWPCLAKIDPANLQFFRQIACEVHWLDRQFDPVALMALTHYHTLVHVHACNYADTFEHDGKRWPKVIECTFLRDDRAEFINQIPALPRPQDSPCNPHAPELFLPIG